MKSLHVLGLGLIATVAAAAILPGAHAADMYRRERTSMKDMPVEYLPPVVWAGFYAGANAGAGWSGDSFDALNDNEQPLGGLHLGYNWQSPEKIVFGIEGDGDIAREFSYLASVRVRLGVAYERALIYATGGVAFAGFKDEHFDETTGWVAGVGFEKMIRDHFSVGVEGLYYGFEEAKYDTLDDSADTWAVRARMSYHFGTGSQPLR